MNAGCAAPSELVNRRETSFPASVVRALLCGSQKKDVYIYICVCVYARPSRGFYCLYVCKLKPACSAAPVQFGSWGWVAISANFDYKLWSESISLLVVMKEWKFETVAVSGWSSVRDLMQHTCKDGRHMEASDLLYPPCTTETLGSHVCSYHLGAGG